jgi:1-acyl-sn-glycerol-3-phosphate acyltransferase
MQRGECVLIYPEGTRIKSDDQPVTVHGGFSLMAQLAKADVVPAAVVGARDVTPQGHHVARPLKVYLKVGAPISFASLGVSKRKEQLQAMEDEAMRQVYLLRDELRREHPGKE